jgi:hypothetical protein
MAIRMPTSNLFQLAGPRLAGVMRPLFSSRLEAQGDRPVSPEMLAALTPRFVGDLDSARKVERPGNPRAVGWSSTGTCSSRWSRQISIKIQMESSEGGATFTSVSSVRIDY